MSRESLKEKIKLHEGFRDIIYKDTLGFRTIGWGHKVVHEDKFEDGKVYSKEELEKVFDADFDKGWNLMQLFCDENNLRSISDTAKEILCNMIFQMGFAGVSKFKMMIAALQQNNFVEAGRQMLDSRWAKQTPNRAQALSKQMEEV